MRKATAQVAFSIPLILLVAAAIGWAGSQGGHRVGGVPVFAFCGILCFALNWLVFIHAYAAQTERYFGFLRPFLPGSNPAISWIRCRWESPLPETRARKRRPALPGRFAIPDPGQRSR